MTKILFLHFTPLWEAKPIYADISSVTAVVVDFVKSVIWWLCS